MNRTKIYPAALLLCLMLCASFVSCSSDCTGEINSGGRTYTAKAKSSEDALRFTCNKYCLDTYAKCDAMYRIWVDSPKGKAAGSPPKMRALSEDKELLDCVTIECANKCIADAGAEKIKAQVNCR